MKICPPVIKFALPVLRLLSVGLLAAAMKAEDTPAAPKTHTLFMGADIDLQQAKGFARVENVSGGSFVIKVDGQEKKIPMKFNSANMRVDHSLKLTETSASVGKLVVDRVYTEGKDPNKKFIRQLAGNAASAAVNSSGYQLGQTLMAKSAQANSGGQSLINLDAELASNQNNLDTAMAMTNSDMNSAGYGANKLAAELEEGMYDAIEITFEVSSEKPLNSPYVVVLAQFSEQGAKPNEVQNWIYATELDPITSETRRVRIKEGGFPPGFVVKNYQLHLYNRGQELATTVASKRVELTRDEAFDYVLIDHLASHKGQTLPATLAMGRLPGAVRNSLPAPALYVKVSRDGLAVAAFADEACTRKIDDPALESALLNLRFKPALDKGKAVDGVARLAF